MTKKTRYMKRKASVEHRKRVEDKRKAPTENQVRLMHEMKAVHKILDDIVSMPEIPDSVKVRVGRMNADPKIFEQMFSEFAKSMGYRGIRVEVESVPVYADCKKCGFRGNVPVIEHVHFVRCPDCKKIADIVRGNELELVE